MSLLSDQEIKKRTQENEMIAPFVETKNTTGVISYGLSSYGYDARVSSKFKIFTNINSSIIDPKNFSENNFVDFDAAQNDNICIIPPNGFALAATVEHFKIPRDVLVLCVGKSTYARCGIIINVTPLEPQWQGYVTIEISNTTPLPAKIYAGEGICQFLFFKADQQCEQSYLDSQGKYMNQQGITLPYIKK